jgi:hypothetical protein
MPTLLARFLAAIKKADPKAGFFVALKPSAYWETNAVFG